MARSNHHYYNICPRNGAGCRHREGPCYGEREFMTRRGRYKRRRRFPDWTWKSYCAGPPPAIRKAWRRQIRHILAQELGRQPDDPVFTPERVWIADRYGWWS